MIFHVWMEQVQEEDVSNLLRQKENREKDWHDYSENDGRMDGQANWQIYPYPYYTSENAGERDQSTVAAPLAN